MDSISKPKRIVERVKECEICGKRIGKIINSRKYGMVLCVRHRDQLDLKGEIITYDRHKPNKIIETNNGAEIIILDKYRKEKCRVIIDKNDIDLVKKRKWTLSGNGYIACTINKKQYYLHRTITNCKKGLIVDHINGNKLDNRRSNLRICTKAENIFNSKIPISNTSGIKGVWQEKRSNRWVARIEFQKKRIHLGNFINKEDAIKAREEAEIKYFGEYRYKWRKSD